jgi:hypothetical protein
MWGMPGDRYPLEIRTFVQVVAHRLAEDAAQVGIDLSKPTTASWTSRRAPRPATSRVGRKGGVAPRSIRGYN